MKNTIYISILTIVIVLGCRTESKKSEDLEFSGSPLVGKIDVWCDESLKKIISQQEEVFEMAYPYAKVNLFYAPELIVKKMFYNDSIDLMILSHGIDSIDIQSFKKQEIYPQQYRFGKSAIAFVGHKNRKEIEYSKDEMLKMIMSGDKNQIFAIENKESGIANELLSYSGSESLGSNVYALNSKQEIFNWIKSNPQGIGIIDWSELSDEDDKEAQKVLSELSIIKILNKEKQAYGPNQENLNGLYSFTRDLYFIRKMGVTDVGLGFASFICEERGQKIMLKAGLLPEYQNERWVEFKGLKDIKVVE